MNPKQAYIPGKDVELLESLSERVGDNICRQLLLLANLVERKIIAAPTLREKCTLTCILEGIHCIDESYEKKRKTDNGR